MWAVAEHPRWYTPPAVEQFAVEAAAIRTMTAHEIPEPGRMVHVANMGELVHQQVAEHFRALEQQAAVEADRAAHGAASPARTLASNGEPAIREAHFPCRLLESGREDFRRATDEPDSQGALNRASVRNIPHQAQQTRRLHADARAAGAPRPLNSPGFSRTRQIDAVRRKGFLRRRVPTRLRALLLDPGPVPLDEPLDGGLRGARRHHHFHASAMEDTHREPPGATALTNAPLFGSIAVGPERQLRGRFVEHLYGVI
jgi:hypothetical protein